MRDFLDKVEQIVPQLFKVGVENAGVQLDDVDRAVFRAFAQNAEKVVENHTGVLGEEVLEGKRAGRFLARRDL